MTLAALWYWRVWDGGLKGPLIYEGDALLYQRLAKTIAQRGWYLGNNPLLGAPAGQELYDYPLGSDNLTFVLLRIFAIGTSNPFVITNLYFYLTFPLAFLACHYAFRRLGISVFVSLPLSVIFALAPYHFIRGVGHLLLSGYYVVPLACLLLYELLCHPSAETRQHEPGDAAPPTLRTWMRSREFWWGRWLWIPVLLGSTGAYYAFFFVFLALAIGTLTALSGRTLRTLARPLVVVTVTVTVLVLNNAPTFIYRVQHGNNELVAKRALGDADLFALQPAYLMIPVQNHRIPPLAAVRARADESTSPLLGIGTAPLGTAAAAGLVLSIAALVAGARGGRGRWRGLSQRSGILSTLALILGCAGGGSFLLGVSGFVQLRDYGRLSIFIAFFSLAALGASIQPLLRRLPDRVAAVNTPVVLALVGVAAGVAILDHTPPRSRGEIHRILNRSEQDRRLATAIEQHLPEDAMVLQLPMLGFPEDAIVFPARAQGPNVIKGFEYYNGYELFRPTLFTSTVRWSYGAIQNRPEDLSPSLGNKPIQLFLRQAVAVGFEGIYLDREALPDDGLALISQLEAHLGEAPLKNDRALFYDLRGYRRNVMATMPPDQFRRLEGESRQPMVLNWGRRFERADGNGRFFPQLPGLTSGHWAANGAALEVTNPSGSTRVLTLQATARLAVAGSAQLTASLGSQVQRFPITPLGAPITLKFTIPPGTSRVRFATDGRDGIQLGTPVGTVNFRLEDVWWEG